ncbi:MAG: hypothetical protein LKF93_09620 [Bifidobacterium tibiigranuli]|jgi:hypothetical protein|nr:hypothetical protein [Bifidobacterium tibiigranuli]
MNNTEQAQAEALAASLCARIVQIQDDLERIKDIRGDDAGPDDFHTSNLLALAERDAAQLANDLLNLHQSIKEMQ